MIIDNLYPDFYGVYMGDTSDQYRAQMTAAFSRTYDGGVIESADNYFLGYIGKDKLPASMQMSVMYFDGDGNLVAEDITDESNFPCGYCWINTTSEVARNIYTIENGVKTFGQYATSAQLMNQNYPMYSGRSHRSTPALSITGFFIIYSPDGTRIFPTGSNADTPSWGINIQYVSDALKFLKGETDYTITLSNSGYKVTINAETIKTGNEYLQCDDADVFVRLIICNFGTTNGGQCKNGGSYNTFYPGFMAKTTGHYNDKTYELLTYGVSMPGLYITSGYGLIQNRPTEENPFFAYIETHGTITAEQLADAQSSTGKWLSWANDGNLAVVRQLASGAGHFAFPVRIMTIDEIARAFYLMYRGDTTVNGITSGYVRNVTYATDVTPQNEFLARWKTGNLSDDNFKNSLRPWQYEDFQEGDFTEDDIPPYEPEPGWADDEDDPDAPDEDGEKEPKNTGDDTVNNNPDREWQPVGLQFFALNLTELEDFSNQLWSQPKSFYDAIQIAGRQTTSIFDYIQSIRYYPFNFSLTNAENLEKVFMGTGAKLKKGAGETEEDYVKYYPARSEAWMTVGNWDLSEEKYKWRKNFLDYAPYTKMSVYLPYVGSVDIDPAQVASFSPISETMIWLHVSLDYTTGTLTYVLSNDYNVLCQKTTKIGMDIPLNGNDAVQQSAAMLMGQFRTTKNLLGAIAGGGTSALTGNVVGTMDSVLSLPMTAGEAYVENSLARKQIPVEISSAGGAFSEIRLNQYPVLTVFRTKYDNPENFGHTIGYLCDRTYTIKALNGFTVCRNVDVSQINHAVDAEKAQIKQIMETGFYA